MPDTPADDIRPVEPAPHDRFFDDGEEPPERYDRADEIEYLIDTQFPLAPMKWLRSARAGYRTFLRQSFRYCGGYIFVWLFGWHMLLGLALNFIEPLFLIPLVRRSIIQLSGEPAPDRDTRLSIREYAPLFGSNAFVFFGGYAVLFGAVYVVYMIELWFGSEWVTPAVVMASLLAIPVIAFICRTFRFVPHLIIDQELGLLQAMRGSWWIWRGKFWSFFGIEIITFLAHLLTVCTLFIGLIFVKPFTTLFWTAAYLEAVRIHREP